MPLVTENNWISIVEYSLRNNLSISTIRRQIRDKKIKYTLMRGKYYIYDESFQSPEREEVSEKEKREREDKIHLLVSENEILKKKIVSLMEEVSELKMLVGIYEGKDHTKHGNKEVFQVS